MGKPRAEKDKRYEDAHKEERRAKNTIWGTSVPREKANQIDEFLKKYGYTKVELIDAGYKALLDDAGEHNLSLGKQWTGTTTSLNPNLNNSKKQNKD